MGLENIFSDKNILSYSSACIDLAVDMAEQKIKKNSFDTLVIPSRGAFPFFLGMLYSLDKLKDIDDDSAKLLENICVQEMLHPLMSNKFKTCYDFQKSKLNVLLIPFTADLNIPKFDKTQDNEEYTTKTREYWARVTHAFLKDNNARSADPYFKSFIDEVLRKIENRGNIAEMYEKFPKVENLSIIDTVISGRASNDILRSFDQIANERYLSGVSEPDSVRPKAFLIVDEDGKKLEKNRRFAVYLRDKESAGQAKLYKIPRIVSEDTNSSLLGVSAAVYPSLMRASKSWDYNGKEFFFGAGSWHINPRSKYKAHFNKFIDLIYSGIDSRFASDYESEEIKVRKAGEFSEKLVDFQKYATDNSMLSLSDEQNSDLDYLDQRNKDVGSIFETHSHVVHIPFNEAYTREVLFDLSPLGVSHRNKN